MLEPGDTISERFRITSLLGRGGFGFTYAAHDLQTNQLVAVKSLALEHVEDWKSVELFAREARVLESLNHPQIPTYIDFIESESDGVGYLAQTLAPGKSLQVWVEEGRRFSETECLELAKQILDILQYLAGLRPPVVHRDIKPANLILESNGTVRLVDFGAVRELVSTNTGSTVVGTLEYMAPEQLHGGATTCSDIYGLGMTLVYLLTGVNPMDLPKKRLKVDYASRVKVSPAFGYVLDLMIEAIPEDRLASAEEALRLLGDTHALNPSTAVVRDEIDAMVKQRTDAEARAQAAQDLKLLKRRAAVARHKGALEGFTQIVSDADGYLLSYVPTVGFRLTPARAAGLFGGVSLAVVFSAIIAIGIYQSWNLAILINVAVWSGLIAVVGGALAVGALTAVLVERLFIRINPSGNFLVYRSEKRPLAFGSVSNLKLRISEAGPDSVYGSVWIGAGEKNFSFDRLTQPDILQFQKLAALADLD